MRSRAAVGNCMRGAFCAPNAALKLRERNAPAPLPRASRRNRLRVLCRKVAPGQQTVASPASRGRASLSLSAGSAVSFVRQPLWHNTIVRTAWLENAQERHKVRLFLRGQDQAEAVFIEMHDIQQRLRRPVVKIGGARSQATRLYGEGPA